MRVVTVVVAFALSASSIGLFGCATESATRSEATLVDAPATQSTEITDAPPTPAQASDASRGCAPVEVAPSFSSEGSSVEEARSDGEALARDLGALFDSVNAGRPDPRLVARSSPLDRRGEVPGPGHVCVLRIDRLRFLYPENRTVAWVDATIDVEGTRRDVEIEVWWRPATHSFEIALRRLFEDLRDIADVERATTSLDGHLGLRIERRIGWTEALMFTRIVGPDGATIRCATAIADEAPDRWSPPVATRCIAGSRASERHLDVRASAPPSESASDSGPLRWFICVEDGSPRAPIYSWPDGAPLAGNCLDGPSDGPAGRSPLAYVTPPFDLDGLGRTELDAVGEDMTVIRRSTRHVVCFGEGTSGCVALPRQEEFVRWTSYVASQSGRWIAVVREREEEGGAEMLTGDRTVVVLRREGDVLELRGFLPVGAYASERIEDRRWRSDDVRASVSAIGDDGCVTVVRRGGRPDPRATRPSRVHGRDPALRDLYDALEIDYSGAWSPSERGGFDRSARCAP